MSIMGQPRPFTLVSVDSLSGRPREIRIRRERWTVTALDAVRDETAAYPPQTGPRRVFLVRSHERRYRLIHLVRDDRWTVEELMPEGPEASSAA